MTEPQIGSNYTIPRLISPVNSESGLQGAELICRRVAAAAPAVVEMGVTLKEAWRGILALLRSCASVGCAWFTV